MGRYILRRLLTTIPVLIVVSLLTFLLMTLVLGDPAIMMLGDEAAVDEETLERMRADLGVDRSLPVQYGDWLWHVVRGDLGMSFRFSVPVRDLVLARIPVTLQLSLFALALSMVLGIPLGIAAALRPGSRLDLGLSTLAMMTLSLPNFWIGILLIFAFALKLGWLPSSGYVSFLSDPGDGLKYMILPAVTLATSYIGNLARYTRAMMIDVLSQDYVRTARAKGLHPVVIIRGHAMRNTLIPVVTVIGLHLTALFGGAVVAETVFSLPGIGTLLVDSIFRRDLPVVQGVLLFITFSVVLINMVVDILYGYLDPRVRLAD